MDVAGKRKQPQHGTLFLLTQTHILRASTSICIIFASSSSYPALTIATGTTMMKGNFFYGTKHVMS
jgi:hypothetical protein